MTYRPTRSTGGAEAAEYNARLHQALSRQVLDAVGNDMDKYSTHASAAVSGNAAPTELVAAVLASDGFRSFLARHVTESARDRDPFSSSSRL